MYLVHFVFCQVCIRIKNFILVFLKTPFFCTNTRSFKFNHSFFTETSHTHFFITILCYKLGFLKTNGKFWCNPGLFRGVQLKMTHFSVFFGIFTATWSSNTWDSKGASSLHSVVTVELSLFTRNCATPFSSYDGSQNRQVWAMFCH